MEASENMAKFFLENNINFRILISDAMSAGNFARARMLFNYFQEQRIPTFKQIIPRSAKMVDAGDQGKTIGNISGARFIADKFTEVALQILEDVANEQSSSLKDKDINQTDKDIDNSK
jgi:nitrogenase subunit NifH